MLVVHGLALDSCEPACGHVLVRPPSRALPAPAALGASRAARFCGLEVKPGGRLRRARKASGVGRCPLDAGLHCHIHGRRRHRRHSPRRSERAVRHNMSKRGPQHLAPVVASVAGPKSVALSNRGTAAAALRQKTQGAARRSSQRYTPKGGCCSRSGAGARCPLAASTTHIICSHGSWRG